MHNRAMIRATFWPVLLLLLTVNGLLVRADGSPLRRAVPPSRAASRAYRVAPAFVRNIGQTSPTAEFFGIGAHPVFFTRSDVRFVDPAARSSLWLTFIGGAAA